MAVSVLKNIICNVPLYKYHSSHKIFSLCGKIFVRYAGHSHWQNVKGTKQAKDLMKNQMYNKYIFLMRKAVYGNTIIFYIFRAHCFKLLRIVSFS